MTTSMSCSMNRTVTPSSRAQPLHVVEQPAPERRVDAGHRLVEQQQLRLRHQRPRELQQLALAAGERAGVVVGEVSSRLKSLEQLHGLLAHLLLARLDGARAGRSRCAGFSPGWSGAASIMLSITGIAASAFVIWKVRTIPRRAISYGAVAEDLARPRSRTDPRSPL